MINSPILFRSREPELTAIHATLTAVMGALGISLALPGELFPTSPSWREFGLIAPEEVWAIGFFVAAMVGALGLNARYLRLRMGSALALTLAHIITAYLFLLGNLIGGLLFAVIASLGLFLWWRMLHLRWRGLL